MDLDDEIVSTDEIEYTPDAFKVALDPIFEDSAGDFVLEVFLSIKDKGILSLLLADLFSTSQLNQLKNKLYAAKVLSRGAPYSTLSDRRRISTKVSAKVSKLLNDHESGISRILNEMYPFGVDPGE